MKNFLYAVLFIGVLATSVVKAEPTITHFPDSGIEYTLNEWTKHFTWVWTITIQSWDDIITILDRNLWATKFWTWCSLTDSWSCGYIFQRWNNHWFERWLTDDWLIELPWWENIIDWRVDITEIGSQYSSWTYYRDNYAFRIKFPKLIEDGFLFDISRYIDYVYQLDIWWADYECRDEGARYQNDCINHLKSLLPEKKYNFSQKQWPCPDGFHVPSNEEFSNLINIMNHDKDTISKTLLMPFAGVFDWAYSVNNINSFFTSTLYLTNSYYDWLSPLSYIWDTDGSMAGNNIINGPYYMTQSSIRCFYNRSSYYPFKVSAYNQWAIQWSWMVDSWSSISWDIVATYLTWLTKEWYTFLWWTISGSNENFDPENDIVTTWLILNAEWTINQYTITFDTDWWNDIAPITWDYWTWITAPANPTKNWYIFDWREPAIPDTMPAENLTIKAKWKKKSSWWSSWWGWMRKDNCPDGDLSPSYYDGTCEGDNTQDSSAEPQNDVTPLTGGDGEARGGYSQEFLNAYERAFKNGITTMNTIDKANMDWYIKRGHLAKMVVNYVTNVLWREIPSDITASCLSFNDEATVRESAEIKDYAIKSCALWLMWINMKNNEFLPNDYVPRSQFGAVLSRILRWDKYNLVHTQEKPRYTDHLNALKEEWIMTKIDNPKMLEKRWYVMIMLMRSVK